MTQNTNMGLLSQASASITSIGDAIRPRVDEVAANVGQHGAYVGDRKLLRL